MPGAERMSKSECRSFSGSIAGMSTASGSPFASRTGLATIPLGTQKQALPAPGATSLPAWSTSQGKPDVPGVTVNFWSATTSAKVFSQLSSEAWYRGPKTTSPSGHSHASPSPAQKKLKDRPSNSQALTSSTSTSTSPLRRSASASDAAALALSSSTSASVFSLPVLEFVSSTLIPTSSSARSPFSDLQSESLDSRVAMRALSSWSSPRAAARSTLQFSRSSCASVIRIVILSKEALHSSSSETCSARMASSALSWAHVARSLSSLASLSRLSVFLT
mmetsp:Transcript_76217/g.184355  ORF Transcript_76217/g.184355 Transcript_76217/m.184355 type:complete len:277 (-) Transcript_76217:893-1723(-)